MNVLLIGPVHTASFNIGVLQPMRYLRQQGLLEFKVRSEREISRSSIDRSDVVVFSRMTKPKAYELLRRAQRKNKKTVYVIDDHFLAMPQSTAIGKRFKDVAVRKTFIKFLQHAQIVKVASPFFAAHLRQHFRPRKVVCFPGSVDFSLVDHLSRVEKNNNKIAIGYAGGNKSIAFVPVVRALKRVLRRLGDKVVIHFFGFIPPELKGQPNVIQHEYEYDYNKYLIKLFEMNWDIGLAPLDKALYHDCKTDNKFREYSACYIPGIYSDTPAYEQSVNSGVTGLLVNNSVDEWYRAIRKMIEHPELRTAIAHQAGKHARSIYTIEQCANQWLKEILHR